MFHSILHKKLGLTSKDKSYRQAYLVLSTLSIVVFVLLFYITYNLIVTKLYYIAALEFISLYFSYLSWYVLVKKKNISMASTILVLTIFTLTLLFIFDHKHKDYALAQAVMFPVLTIYLKGLRVGTIYSLIYIAAVLVIAFFGIDNWDPVPFTSTSFTNLTFTYIVVISLIYYYEVSRVEAFEIIERSHNELKEYKDNLVLKVEEALEEKRQQEQILIQQSKMAVMGEMIASIVHQWKQPLAITSSILSTEKIKNELSEKPKRFEDQFFDSILTQINYMDQTVSDFSGFFKPNREKEFFSLSSSIEDIINILEYQLSKHQIRLENNVPEGTLMIEGYRNEFSQVLLNVISNAKDAISENIKKGIISSDEGKIRLEATFETNKVHLLVCDNGGGIPEDILPNIFNPYITTKTKGTGIGLYMSNIIMETHMQGHISASNRGDGTCIDLELRGIKRQL